MCFDYKIDGNFHSLIHLEEYPMINRYVSWKCEDLTLTSFEFIGYHNHEFFMKLYFSDKIPKLIFCTKFNISYSSNNNFVIVYDYNIMIKILEDLKTRNDIEYSNHMDMFFFFKI